MRVQVESFRLPNQKEPHPGSDYRLGADTGGAWLPDRCDRSRIRATDGLVIYVKAFRSKRYTGWVGAPRLIAWPEVMIGQVLRRYKRRRVVDVERRPKQANFSQLRSSKHGPYRAIERDFPSEAGGIGEA